MFDVVQDRTVRISWKQEIRAQLRQIFNGAAYKLILDEAPAIHQKVLRSRVFVALHMHAGDGNVHTNLPVGKSDDASGESIGAEEMLGDRVPQADEVLAEAEARWRWLLAGLDQPLATAKEQLYQLGL